MGNAIIYARLSTQGQAGSMDNQIEQCRAKAQAIGVAVAEVFQDICSSEKDAVRPGFQAALAYCAEHPGSHFISFNSSRVSRDEEEFKEFLSKLSSHGTELVFVNGGVSGVLDFRRA